MKKKILSILVTGIITLAFITGCGNSNTETSDIERYSKISGVSVEDLENMAKDAGIEPEEFARSLMETVEDTGMTDEEFIDAQKEHDKKIEEIAEVEAAENEIPNKEVSGYEIEESDLLISFTREDAEVLGITNDKYINYWTSPEEFLGEYENIYSFKASGSYDPEIGKAMLPNSGFFEKLVAIGMTKEECIEMGEDYFINADLYSVNLFLSNIKGKTFNDAAICFDDARKTSGFLETLSIIFAENQFDLMEPESQIQFLLDMANGCQYLEAVK